MKSELLKDHFLHPRGMGAAADATHHAIAKSEVCNDIVKMTARIRGGVIEEVRTQVYGCGYAIAGASLFNERATGMGARDAARMDAGALVAAGDDIPERHRHCVGLALRAYLKLYDDYREDA